MYRLVYHFFNSYLYASVKSRFVVERSQSNDFAYFVFFLFSFELFFFKLVQIALHQEYFLTRFESILNWHSDVHNNQRMISLAQRVITISHKVFFIFFNCLITVLCFIQWYSYILSIFIFKLLIYQYCLSVVSF